MGKEVQSIYNRKVKLCDLDWSAHYRIIPSRFPPIDFFENLVSPELMAEVFYIESLTNDRLRNQVGDISLVDERDRVSGKGSSNVMAAFTHPATDGSRFSSGEYGIYYAAKDLTTAIKETIYHTERFLSFTNEPSGFHTKRVLKGKRILKPLLDIRHPSHQDLHHPDNIELARAFGAKVKRENGCGILYNSVRDQEGECIAVFRPNAIELPIVQTQHLQYFWDGKKITNVVEISAVAI